MNEKELVNLARGGNEAAFEQLVRLYEKKIYNLCLRICGNAEDAQDAAQDAFVAAWRALENFRGDAAFSTWLYRLASNACLDLLRRKKRESGSVSLDDPDTPLEIRDDASRPDEIYEKKEAVEQVKSALAALPAEYRTVLVLREMQQLSYTEIAEVTQLELGTVKSRINRARALVRNYLAASGNFFAARASKEAEMNERSVSRE